MTCNDRCNHVEKSLNNVNGVIRANVGLDKATVSIEMSAQTHLDKL